MVLFPQEKVPYLVLFPQEKAPYWYFFLLVLFLYNREKYHNILMGIGKIPHTEDIESPDRCGQQHRCHSRVYQEYKNPKKFTQKKIIQNGKLKNVQRYAKISDIPFDQRSLIHREAWFPPCFEMKNQQKNKLFLRVDFRPYPNQNVQF